MPEFPTLPQPLSVRWTGTFTAPQTGDFTFDLATSNSSVLYWDDTVLIDDSGSGVHDPVVKTATVHLVAGEPHAVRIDYTGAIDFGSSMTGARVKFGWQPPAGTVDRKIAAAVDVARRSDVAVIVARDYETEALDRPDLSLPNNQDRLISAVAAANPRTIVVLQTGAPVTMPWLDQVPAVLETWYPGELGGAVVSSLLFGDADPGGRLPITFPRSESQLPANTPPQFPGVDLTAYYSERLRVGYRHYDAVGLDPLFAFGHGLSYTTFRQKLLGGGADRAGNGGVAVAVTNTGERTGSQVVQGYVGFPASVGEPPKQLKAFDKITLRPGQHRVVGLRFSPDAFAHWDTASHSWAITAGTYRILVGSSSRDIYGQVSVRMRQRNLGP
jgi:beta-glucosidase